MIEHHLITQHTRTSNVEFRWSIWSNDVLKVISHVLAGPTMFWYQYPMFWRVLEHCRTRQNIGYSPQNITEHARTSNVAFRWSSLSNDVLRAISHVLAGPTMFWHQFPMFWRVLEHCRTRQNIGYSPQNIIEHARTSNVAFRWSSLSNIWSKIYFYLLARRRRRKFSCCRYNSILIE